MAKRIMLDTENKKVTGLCAGIAKYFDLDPSLIRLAVLAGTLFTSVVPGVLFYLIASLIIPTEGDTDAKA
jgi:phage shock protein C